MQHDLFTRTQWFKFPPALKRRWWEETDYSKNEPSEELRRAIIIAVRQQENP